jgi:phosphoribosylformylglycinamidine synthase
VDPVKSKKIMESIHSAIKKGLIVSAHDCSEGGMAVCLAEMLFSGGMGARVNLGNVPREKRIDRDDVLLFSESNSRFIVEVPEDKEKDFLSELKGQPCGLIGMVSADSRMTVDGLSGERVIDADITKLKKQWKKPFGKLMHEKN